MQVKSLSNYRKKEKPDAEIFPHTTQANRERKNTKQRGLVFLPVCDKGIGLTSFSSKFPRSNGLRVWGEYQSQGSELSAREMRENRKISHKRRRKIRKKQNKCYRGSENCPASGLNAWEGTWYRFQQRFEFKIKFTKIKKTFKKFKDKCKITFVCECHTPDSPPR